MKKPEQEETIVFRGSAENIQKLAAIAEQLGGVSLIESVEYLEVLPHKEIESITYGNVATGFVSVVRFIDETELDVATIQDFESYNETIEEPTKWARANHIRLHEHLMGQFAEDQNSRNILENEAAALFQTWSGVSMIPLRMLEMPARHHKQGYTWGPVGVGPTSLKFVSDYLDNALTALSDKT